MMTEAETRTRLKHRDVPEYLHAAIVRYLVHRIMPGDFLQAVIVNDLKESLIRADQNSVKALKKIVAFFYYDSPGGSWGSPEIVKTWLQGGDDENAV